MKTVIISATKSNDISKTILYQSLQSLTTRNVSFTYEFEKNNSTGLSKVYNKYIEQYADQTDCMIFAHDDVYIDDAFFIDKIEDSFCNGYDIIGVAGGVSPNIKAPTLWHIMCGQGNLRGAAGHFSPDMSAIQITSFGPMPARVALLDGLFIAVNTKKIREAGWKFNENYDFHLYDLASCLDANKKKLRMGVIPIHLIHKSPGLTSFTDCFNTNQAKFLAEYS